MQYLYIPIVFQTTKKHYIYFYLYYVNQNYCIIAYDKNMIITQNGEAEITRSFLNVILSDPGAGEACWDELTRIHLSAAHPTSLNEN